jgi:RNA polymerase sigma-70 factor, ECF subfamily
VRPWVQMVGPTDGDLIGRFASGDKAAIREIYARYSGPIFTVAMGTLAKRDLADEVVQTTMLKAWRASGTFDPSRELAPWLYAIARRTAIDVYRREQRNLTHEELADDQVAVVPLSFERTWEAWEVRNAVEQLPDHERDVIRLAHFHGMTHSEIAERLGVPIGTVKSRANRAHGRLATLLAHVVGVAE